MKKYFYVYCSYEQWGRSYIGKRECLCPPTEDVSYLGSFSDKTFKPTEKIIIAEFESSEEAYAAEEKLHAFFKVDENPRFANKRLQSASMSKSSAYKHPHGCYWVNDGYRNRFLKLWQEIPEGFTKGKLPLGYKNTQEYLQRHLLELEKKADRARQILNSPEAQAKKEEYFRKGVHQRGKNNSQYGTRCIHNLELKKTARIRKEDPIPEGWLEGAKYNFSPEEVRPKVQRAKRVSKDKSLSWEENQREIEEIIKKDELRRAERELQRQKQKQLNIEYYTNLYHIYCQEGFEGVLKTGYNKTKANLVQQMSKYVPNFKPQNGKKRGT